jgi:Na+-driven multidrug efflux pump
MGLCLALGAPLFLTFFHVQPAVHDSCRIAAWVLGAVFPMRVLNLIWIVGICRNGGDTVFAAVVDALAPWCVGIPMAALGVLVLQWRIHWVMALVALEEAVKFGFGLWRLYTGKWLHNLVRDIHGGVVGAAG